MPNTPAPTPSPVTCPPWCTTNHALESGIVPTYHQVKTGEEIIDGKEGPTVMITAAVIGDDIMPPEIGLSYTALRGSAGAALLTPRAASAIAGLLRALGHVEIADALDRAVATLGGES